MPELLSESGGPKFARLRIGGGAPKCVKESTEVAEPNQAKLRTSIADPDCTKSSTSDTNPMHASDRSETRAPKWTASKAKAEKPTHARLLVDGGTSECTKSNTSRALPQIRCHVYREVSLRAPARSSVMRVNRCVREPRLLLVVQEGLGLGLFVLDLLSYPLLRKYASAAPASQTKTYHFSTQCCVALQPSTSATEYKARYQGLR